MFWEAVRYDHASNPTLPVPTPTLIDHTLGAEYPLQVAPARATVRVRMRPIGMDVLHDLVDAGYLDDTMLAEMPTFTMEQQEVSWNGDPDEPTVVSRSFPDCDRYKCLLDPSSERCAE